ncbi:hypothetical protein Tco_0327966 [Tanacetum coccineum]
MFYKKNIDYVYLLWEYLMFQIENKEAKKTNKMSYPRFTKIIIDYFMSKDQSILRKNKMFWHTARDDTMFTSMRCISRHEDTQVYGTILPKNLFKLLKVPESSLKVAKSNKKKQPTKKLKAKGLAVLSEVALTEAEQLKLATKRSKTRFHSSHASGSGDGVETQSKVPDEQQQKTSGTDEGTDEDEDDKNDSDDISDEGDDDNDGNNGNDSDDDDKQEGDDTNDDDEETDSDRTESDRIKIPIFDQSTTEYYEEEENIDDEETMYDDEEDEVTKEFYEDVNMNLGNEDTEMTNADQGASEQQNVSQELGFEQVEEDAHVTLTPEMMQDNDLKNSKSKHKGSKSRSQSMNDQSHYKQDKTKTRQSINVKSHIFNVISGVKMTETKIETPLLDQTDGRKEGNQVKMLSHPEIQEEPSHTIEDSSMQQDQEFVTRDNDEQPADKEVTKADWFKKPERPPTPDPNWKPPTSFDELNDTSFDFSAFVMNWLKIPNLTQEILVGPAFNLLKGTCKSITELEYHLEECSKATTERLDWHNPENKPYPFDLRKPLLLIQDHRGRQIIPKDYFINKDLEYLKGGDLSRRYSTSVTKTKAATYELKWIEDLVPELWSPVQLKYDQHAYLGTSHWGPKRQSFYGYASNLTSSKDVYSRRKIIAVTRLKIMKKYDYGHLEEIEVRRDDQKLYTFKEGDFKRLRLQDIEDMLLLLVQQKLTNLTIDERYDLNVALRMYTRRIIIQRRVKDLQLGVESYQKKLNLTKPDRYRLNIKNKTAYTSYSDPHGIIYVDLYKRKRLMRADKLHKFSDGTLNDVRSALHDIAARIRMEYLPMRKWSNLDKKRARVMVQDIDKRLY